MRQKICSGCRILKTESEFFKDASKPQGLQTRCKACVKKRTTSPEGVAKRKAYQASPLGQAARQRMEDSPKAKARYRRYRASEKGKATRKRNRSSPRCVETYDQYYASPKVKEIVKQYNSSPAGRIRYRKSRLKTKYRLTEEDYTRMLNDQGGVCAICGNTNSGGQRLAIDHCHTTNIIRGLLCGRCNPALGLLRDDPAICQAAMGYLLASPKVSLEGLV